MTHRSTYKQLFITKGLDQKLLQYLLRSFPWLEHCILEGIGHPARYALGWRAVGVHPFLHIHLQNRPQIINVFRVTI